MFGRDFYTICNSHNVSLIYTEQWNREITRQIKAVGARERKDSIVLPDGLYTASIID